MGWNPALLASGVARKALGLPLAAAFMTAMLALSTCATRGSDRRGQACPPVVAYNSADEARAADEIEGRPEGAVIVRMRTDYAVMHDQALARR